MFALGRIRWVPLRFGLSGLLVAACHFGTMTVLVVWLELNPHVALALAYGSALVLHFTLNRRFVFASDGGYALHLSLQGMRYLAVALTSYVVTNVAVAFVPRVLDTPPLVVFYVATCVLAVVSFLVLRQWVFHSRAPALLAAAGPRSTEKA